MPDFVQLQISARRTLSCIEKNCPVLQLAATTHAICMYKALCVFYWVLPLRNVFSKIPEHKVPNEKHAACYT